MSVIVVNKFCDSIQKIRLFDSRALILDMDLSVFTKYTFEVFEPGIKKPILELDSNNISASAEFPGYPDNLINVKITMKDIENMLPNPYTSDKVREFRLLGNDKDGMKILLKQDCFYVEDTMMGR